MLCVPGSLCTMLSLQWEPEIIAVAVMYLAGRLCKFDIQEWTAKQSSRRWWEQFVQDVPVELLEGADRETFVLSQRFAPPTFVSTKKTRVCCRYLSSDPGPVFPGEQDDSSAATGEGEDAGSSCPCTSNPTGTTTSQQPSSPTTKEDLPSGKQPCAPAQTLTRECMCECVPSLSGRSVLSRLLLFFKVLHFSVFPSFLPLFSFTQTSPKDEPKAPGKHA